MVQDRTKVTMTIESHTVELLLKMPGPE